MSSYIPNKRKRKDDYGDNFAQKKRKLNYENDLPDTVEVVTISSDAKNEELDNFNISEGTKEIMIDNSWVQLFPIQSYCYNYVFEGRDIIGKARTGTGKTLSFSLPVVESLIQKNVRPTGYPFVLIMAPTRELARQVHSVIDTISQKFSTIVIHGGVSYDPQIDALQRGIDIVVGTPGRIIDLLDRGVLNLKDLKYFVLDEADQMLDMGFREDIEKVLTFVPPGYQGLFYSATMPEWVRRLAKKFFKPNFVIVDLVGDDENQTSKTVQHLAIKTTKSERTGCLADVVGVYSRGGKTIVFCETKAEANELGMNSSIAQNCAVLHGDIAQSTRESTLQSFRDGYFKILVATDVAARGLDIDDVDLVIQTSPPNDHKSYIHRSGRTGRAGRSGVSLTFYTYKEESSLKDIEKKASVSIQRVGMPQAKDIYRVSADVTAENLQKVDDDIKEFFLPFAEKYIQKNGSAELALAAAFALLGGFTKKVKGRSLLSSMEDHVAVLAETNEPIRTRGFVMNDITRQLEGYIRTNDKVMKEMKFTIAGGMVVDMPSEYAKLLIQNNRSRIFKYSIPTSLPELKEEEARGGYHKRNTGRGGYNNRRNYGGYNNTGGYGGYNRRNNGYGRRSNY